MRTTTPNPKSSHSDSQRTQNSDATLTASKRAIISQPTQHTVSLPGYTNSSGAPTQPIKDYEAAYGKLASSYGSPGVPCLPKREPNSNSKCSFTSSTFKSSR
ncbi:hypothetical protein HWV62_23280 [Athelia sp. TMB]|nr:hypothetical protein HWV62_23280 [Athelia sp. TMB]